MDRGLFWRQFVALFWKNWIILWKYRWLNLLRCVALPIGYGIFLAVAQLFLSKPNNYGIGSPIAVLSLQQEYDGSSALVWADGTNGTTNPTPDDIMSHISSGFTTKQLRGIKKVATPDDIPSACQENFNLFSECYAAIAFTPPPEPAVNGNQTVAYTLRGDGGLFHIDVVHHKSDYEKRLMPLQWAVDSAIIELTTGEQVPTPLEWPFTQETNKEQFTDIRLSYIRGIRQLLVLALFICYIGIAYQLPGAFMGDRANLLTSHLKAMGLLDSARIVSWHISISLAYLPAWIIVAIIWHFQIFTATSIVLVLLIHLLFPISLASWSFFVATPFGKSAQLAAVASTFLSIVFAVIALVLQGLTTGIAVIYILLFPPGFYIFAIRAVCGWENNQLATNALKPDPDKGLTLLPLLIAALINIFLWPWLAVLLERRLYDARNPRKSRRSWRFWGKRQQTDDTEPHVIPPDTAISIRNLGKDFGGKGNVTAIADLSLDIPKSGIYVLLGSNGAGKSTTMSILGGLIGRTRGSILFEENVEKPPRGTIGIVPQKNVLFPELTCYQTLRVWKEVKRTSANSADEDEDIEQLLRDCDLGNKIHYDASKLSGGQKRKLQLAIGLVGGSKIVLVDECTSGVDPLSRRALWRTLISVRHERTVVFTTHFLDEADLLADTIAILAAPGRLVAEGTPVSLKSSLGEGYTVHVSFDPTHSLEEKESDEPSSELLPQIQMLAPLTYVFHTPPHDVAYHLKSKDAHVVKQVLQLVEDERKAYRISSYSVLGTSMEDIFLGLMQTPSPSEDLEKVPSPTPSLLALPAAPATALELTAGRSTSPLLQAFTIFHKRVLVARRSWLTPMIAVLVAVCGSCIPLFYLSGRDESCQTTFLFSPDEPLYLPNSSLLVDEGFLGATDLSGSQVLVSPPGALSILGPTIQSVPIANVTDNATFINEITQNFQNLSIGGVSFDFNSGASVVAWEATPPGFTGLTLLNLASNVLFNHALNTSGKGIDAPTLIMAQYQSFPGVDAETLVALQWVAFFGAALSVYPAFFSMYVSRERRSSVQAMQLSNGLSNPIGLWVGHLLFDSIFSLITATIIIVVFASVSEVSNQFHGLGLFWLTIFLYGVTGTLFSYCVSLFAASPLAAFAIAAGYQVIMFVLYLAGYLLTDTYAKTSQAASDLTIIHYTLSLLSPVASVLRASFVSVNLFSLLCSGTNTVSPSSMAVIGRYGGPILYLIIYSLVLFAILVWVDTGSSLTTQKLLARGRKDNKQVEDSMSVAVHEDVTIEASKVAASSDPLRVLNIVKTFGSAANRVVDGVSLGVARDTIFALLGPNGAGKTTTFNVIRGDVTPDAGDALINGVSIVQHPREARLSLGVCPQFTAIDSQLTVREHLMIYGRLKGLRRGSEVEHNVDSLMEATSLKQYADRLASKLSGGNQRKLSLAIALIGNPSVVLIDEFSTGIDAKMKREMWNTLRNIAVGKAIVITTHSMEEASALANKVGILAKKMLAVGTMEDLSARHATYEVHFSCRTRDEISRAQELMARIPGSRMADDVATRFEVPMTGGGMTLSQLFAVLSSEEGLSEYTVERATLESVFLKVIRENNVAEEDHGGTHHLSKKRWRMC